VFCVLAVAVVRYFEIGLPRTIDDGPGGLTVRDGDSFVLDKTSIRLDGIDAPELKQNCTSADGSIWRCGPESRKQLGVLLKQGDVKCSSTAKDRYGRSISTCVAGKIPDVAREMVRQGWATASGRLGEGKYAAEEEEARRAKRGIWQGPFERPKKYREDHPREDAPAKVPVPAK
jgi:endonuclease YncB( thermonuclease family)